jgi:hypothetical protein
MLGYKAIWTGKKKHLAISYVAISEQEVSPLYSRPFPSKLQTQQQNKNHIKITKALLFFLFSNFISFQKSLPQFYKKYDFLIKQKKGCFKKESRENGEMALAAMKKTYIYKMLLEGKQGFFGFHTFYHKFSCFQNQTKICDPFRSSNRTFGTIPVSDI